MSNIIDRRLAREFDNLMKEKNRVEGLKVSMIDGNVRYYLLELVGPADTPYKDGLFKLELFYTDKYPSEPPKVRFLNKIYHPNIDKLGRICLDILKDKWSAVIQMRTLGLSLMALLANPNLDDPLDAMVAKYFRENPNGARETAIEWTKKYAN